MWGLDAEELLVAQEDEKRSYSDVAKSSLELPTCIAY